MLVHGIVRRRAGRILAFAITAVVGTAPTLLAHTDFLLSEYPHAVAIGVFVWWIDRIRRRRHAARRDRPASSSCSACWPPSPTTCAARASCWSPCWRSPRSSSARPPAAAAAGPGAWRPVLTPYAAFVAFVVGFQLLLPSMLIPDNGDSPRSSPSASATTSGAHPQLGLATHANLGAAILLLAVAGMVVGCWRRPRLNVPLAALTVLSVLAVSTHLRLVERYYFQVLPWVLYFAATAVVAAVAALTPLRIRRLAPRASPSSRCSTSSASTLAVLPNARRPATSTQRAGASSSGPPTRRSSRSSRPSELTPRPTPSSPTTGPAP